MWRLALPLGAAAALMSALGASVVWTRSALTTAYAQGEAAGRSDIKEQVARATLRAQLDAQQRVASANAAVVALEGERDKLQERMHVLDRTVDHDRAANRACLDRKLVRALGRLSR